jgi:hypothetical protein
MTYFGIVYDHTRDEDDEVVLWVGTSPYELYEVEDLRRALRGAYPDVARHLQDLGPTLYGDRDDGL